MIESCLLVAVHPSWYPTPLALFLALALVLPLPPSLLYFPPSRKV